MSKLTKRGRSRISAKNFVFPNGTKAAKGEPKFPINNRAHARSALSRAAQKRTKLTKTERCKVVQKVCDKFPTVGLCKTNTVSKKSLFAKCNGVAVAVKGPKGRKRTYKDAQGYTVNQWSAPKGRGPKSERGLERSMKVISIQRF